MEDAGTLARLSRSAERVAELHESLAAEQERRDQLIVQARDEGTAWRQLAAAARMSTTRAVTIVAEG
jgi:hypothetical protein